MPKITEVNDRPLPTKIDKDCLESARKGSEGIGLNEKSYVEQMADFNQGVDIKE
jgi:hypothetical protein